ncbi:MAG: hypothetical protein J6R20_03375 [Clostridia bacterium]|nr:hypothetical protein [Clostridia bacterium]
MNDNVLKLIMPMMKAENNNDIGLILPLVLLIAVDSGDMPLILCLLYIIMQ